MDGYLLLGLTNYMHRVNFQGDTTKRFTKFGFLLLSTTDYRQRFVKL